MSIKRQELDFDIQSLGNPKTMLFVDMSQYFEEPERPLLQILLPGYTKYFTVSINARRINVLNSNIIGLSKSIKTSDLVALPDGVWTLTYRICPYDKLYKQSYHLRTVALKAKLAKVREFLNAKDCEDCEWVKNAVVDILLLIWSGEAAAQEGERDNANSFYQKACAKTDRLVDKLFNQC